MFPKAMKLISCNRWSIKRGEK